MSRDAKQIIWATAIYLVLRLFSYLFSPPTPLWSGSFINSLIALSLLILATYWFIKKDPRGWIIVAGEIILGGGGGYLSIGPIALRTALLASSLLMYFCRIILENNLASIKSNLSKYFLFVLGAAIFSTTIAFVNRHPIGLVASDLIPYAFILYFFPLRNLVRDQNFINASKNMILGAIMGNLAFISFTFAGFGSGLFVLQDHYYHWFRDVAGGKITDLGFNFFRTTLNEQLLLVPLLIASLYKAVIQRFSKIFIFISFALVFILTVNFTRIYLLALIVGFFLLIRTGNWKRVVAATISTIVCFFVIFTSLHLVVSRGQNAGLELFGLRISSIAAPAIEESSLSRMLLLPEILKKIGGSPVLGTGLGDTVTVFSPALNQTITTPHFDWGYLEIAAEMGIIGIIAWLVLILQFIIFIIKKEPQGPLLAGFGSILIINLTSPALFHVFGIVMIVAIAALISRAFQEQPPSSPDNHLLPAM